MDTEALIMQVVQKVMESIDEPNGKSVPVGVSNRHIHITREHLDILYGKDYELTNVKTLMGADFAAKETLTVVGPSMRALEQVRILGPCRKVSQVEISKTDSYYLKVNAPVRLSGDIKGSAGVTLIGPKGSVVLGEGCIIAKAHIHMTEADALKMGFTDGQTVDVMLDKERKVQLFDIPVRVSTGFHYEMHLDTDEANAAGVSSKDRAIIVRK